MSISEIPGGDIAASTNTDGQLNVFGQVYGYIAAGDSDWYRAWLEAGRAYTFTMSDRDSPDYNNDFPFDSLVTLRDANGTLLATGSEDQLVSKDDSILVFTPTSTGTYYVTANGYQDSGSYVLQMTTAGGASDIPEDLTTAARLIPGGSLSSQIEVASDVDWLQMQLSAAGGYVLGLSGTLPSPLLSLFDRNGNFLNEINAGQAFSVADDGTYFVEIGSELIESTGGYTASLSSLPTLTVDSLGAVESTGSMVFTVHLSQASATAVTFNASTLVYGTASPGSDFEAKSQVLTIAPGATTATFTVPLFSDALLEPDEQVYVGLINAVGAAAGSFSIGFGIISDDDTGSLVLPSDALVTRQWHLYPTVGANVLPVWADYTGSGVKVAIFDQGIERSHPELDDQLLSSLGRDAASLTAGGDPKRAVDNHGTAVAGVIAAERNGVDGVGVAYGAKLVSIYSPLLLSELVSGNTIANAYTHAQGFDILDDSWGFTPQGASYTQGAPWALLDNFSAPQFAAEGAALKQLADAGRSGLGTIVVQSAGNGYGLGDDANLHNFQNSRYVITVAGTDYRGNVTPYNSPGASILVAAPGGGGGDPSSVIWTTDRAGALGYSDGNFTSIRGSSFSAPIVSGVVALMLQANPSLGYRDVQQILAYSAHLTSVQDNSWRYNGAGNWNGGGLHFDAEHHDLGFGLVDARAAVRLAESWSSPAATSANDVEVKSTLAQTVAIPDGSGPITQSQIVTQAIEVERVEVTIDIQHANIGDLALRLTSPKGTESWLLWRAEGSALSAFGSNQANINFTFDTVLSMGESSVGRWDLSVFDLATGHVGNLRSWTLNLVGKADSADDVYVYNDEYVDALAAKPERGTLTDTGGTDTLNAAQVTGRVAIDLNAGAASTIDGIPLKIAAGSTIENAWGGDGNDTLTGNAAANQLFGGRGNDHLFGGAGNDTIDGGQGTDVAGFAGQRSSFVITRTDSAWIVEDKIGAQGKDTLGHFERLQFDNMAVALDFSGNAGSAAQIVRALFGSATLKVPEFTGYGVVLLDQGMSYTDLVALAVHTDAFWNLAGDLSKRSNTAFVKAVYKNVVGTEAPLDDLTYFVDLLDTGALTQASLGLLACRSPLNTGSVDLVGLATQGLDYIVPPELA